MEGSGGIVEHLLGNLNDEPKGKIILKSILKFLWIWNQPKYRVSV